MAIEFLQSKVVSRESIRGVPAHLAYRACTKVHDVRQNKTFDYSHKESVIASFLVNAGGNDLEALGNKMEAAENRTDARVCREYILALPHELDLEENKRLCQEFADGLVKKFGLAIHVAIHKPDELRPNETCQSEDSSKNIHAHITVSERRMGEDGNFVDGNKDREINTKKFLDGLKKDTRHLMNRYLKKSGHETIEKRDPAKLATEHLGPAQTHLERRGINTEKGDRNRIKEHINDLEAQKKGVSKDLNLLAKGLVQKGNLITPAKFIKYNPNDPVIYLSRRTRAGLFDEMAKGHLRPKKWHGPGILESVKFKGVEISITELLLSQRGFTYGKLQSIEHAMDRRFGLDPEHFGIYRKRIPLSDRDRRYRVNCVRNAKRTQSGDAKINAYIPRGAIEFEEKQAFWHAQQAAREIEQS